jgi:hypothetical protein
MLHGSPHHKQNDVKSQVFVHPPSFYHQQNTLERKTKEKEKEKKQI